MKRKDTLILEKEEGCESEIDLTEESMRIGVFRGI
jgi:hypothetical protein